MKEFINAEKNMKCGLIGEHLKHSFSPVIHSHLSDYEYTLHEIEPSKLEDFFKSTELSAFNVTIPYKKAVIPYLSKISKEAERIGAVNTVIKQKDRSFFGDNTDYYGFRMLLLSTYPNISNSKALVLGSGGASVTVNAVLEDLGVDEIVTVSRSGAVNYENVYSLHADASVIINTTPVGMYPATGKSPIDVSRFSKLRAVLDLIYNPARTQLLLDVEKLNSERSQDQIKFSNGLLMLVAQAKRACELFLGETIADSVIPQITSEIRKQTENLILIGMPGCGKSTAGKNLSMLTGKRFVDTDELLLKYSNGLSPAQCIEALGVSEFRRIESLAVEEIGKESGLIIATGGGVPTIDSNYPSLHQNGIMIRIDRSVTELSTKGRPLSQGKNLESLYAERLPHYLSFADISVKSEKNPQDTARAILRAYEKVLNS